MNKAQTQEQREFTRYLDSEIERITALLNADPDIMQSEYEDLLDQLMLERG